MTVLSALRETAGFFGERIAEKPGTAGGATALFVAMTFFTANAVYFQDRQHPSALFATRPDLAESQPAKVPAAQSAKTQTAAAEPKPTRFAETKETVEPAHPVIPKIAPVPARRPDIQTAEPVDEKSDQSLAGIQDMLAKLGYYDGAVDGLSGPMTLAAIDAYKQKSGLRGIELTQDELMTSLRNNLGVTAAIPEPKPDAVKSEVTQMVEDLIASAADGSAPLPEHIPSAEVVKVQAALRAFGNTDIVVDGVRGEQTTAAIREFQALFHLPVTGEIDGTLLDKMRAVGLIQ